jgi:TRAP-type mannitol/chloroaromatic compound transport system substrate-binding protein
MAGLFNIRLNNREDLNGLKMRIPGLAGEVFDAAGGSAVRIAGGEVYTSMQTGVIDAVEWVGPYNDRTLGLMEVGDYYYYPGWHEPGAMLEIIVNADALAALPADLQAIVRVAARATNTDMLDDFTAHNSESLQILLTDFDTEVLPLPDDIMDALYDSSQVAIQSLVESDPMARKIADSYFDFAERVRTYHEISERAYLNGRDRLLPPVTLTAE